MSKLKDRVPSFLLPKSSIFLGASASSTSSTMSSSLDDVGSSILERTSRSGSVEMSPRRRASSVSSGIRLTNFGNKLDGALLHNESLKEEMLAHAKKHFAEENILFYVAIREWEVAGSLGSPNKRKRELTAKAIVAKFVKAGAKMENGCLSSATRADLLEAVTIDGDFFANAKQEVLNDIYMNTTLRAFVDSLHLETKDSGSPLLS